MGIKLPAPLTGYYASLRARDIEGVLALFAETAVVEDEREEHHGKAAIRSWMRRTAEKYGALEHEPTAFAEKDGVAIVTSTVSGNFKGSPATLRYTFTLEGDRIARLTIA
ncbi:MAG: nuclear transport factor 2 family protein [Polyangiaceae bacterium]